MPLFVAFVTAVLIAQGASYELESLRYGNCPYAALWTFKTTKQRCLEGLVEAAAESRVDPWTLYTNEVMQGVWGATGRA